MPTYSVFFCSSNQVGVKTSTAQMLPTNVQLRTWETFSEDVSTIDADSKFTVVGLLEQLNVTRDMSDYLWYTTRYERKHFICLLTNVYICLTMSLNFLASR